MLGRKKALWYRVSQKKVSFKIGPKSALIKKGFDKIMNKIWHLSLIWQEAGGNSGVRKFQRKLLMNFKGTPCRCLTPLLTTVCSWTDFRREQWNDSKNHLGGSKSFCSVTDQMQSLICKNQIIGRNHGFIAHFRKIWNDSRYANNKFYFSPPNLDMMFTSSKTIFFLHSSAVLSF